MHIQPLQPGRYNLILAGCVRCTAPWFAHCCRLHMMHCTLVRSLLPAAYDALHLRSITATGCILCTAPWFAHCRRLRTMHCTLVRSLLPAAYDALHLGSLTAAGCI